MSPDSPITTRRALLKTIGATSLAAGATGVASADAPADLECMEAVHADPLRARWAAAQHADPVLAELADRGVLERGDIAELDFDDADVNDDVTVRTCWYEHRCITLSCGGTGGSYCQYQERHCCDNCTEARSARVPPAVATGTTTVAVPADRVSTKRDQY
jgi:hypothetical protein